jgi:hypothetical protein
MWEHIKHILFTPGNVLSGQVKLENDTNLLDILDAFIDPVAWIAGLVFILLWMMGSKRAGKFFYWTTALYIVIKVVLSAL